MIDFANALRLLGTDQVTAELRDVLLPFLAKTEKDRRHLLLREGFKSLLNDGARFAQGLAVPEGTPHEVLPAPLHILLPYYKLSTTRLEPGARADGVAVFDRPNFKQSTEKLFLQIAQADQVDRPILIRLPFIPPVASDGK